MKKIVIVSFIVSLVSNYLVTSPILLFWCIWLVLGYCTYTLAKAIDGPFDWNREMDSVTIVTSFAIPPITLFVYIINDFDKIKDMFKEKFPNVKLPKIRNPFTWE